MNDNICHFLTKNSPQDITDLFKQHIAEPIPDKSYPLVYNSADFHVQFFFLDTLNLKSDHVIIGHFTTAEINSPLKLKRKLDALKMVYCPTHP